MPVYLLTLQLGTPFPDWEVHMPRASQLVNSRAGLAPRSFDCQFRPFLPLWKPLLVLRKYFTDGETEVRRAMSGDRGLVGFALHTFLACHSLDSSVGMVQ